MGCREQEDLGVYIYIEPSTNKFDADSRDGVCISCECDIPTAYCATA